MAQQSAWLSPLQNISFTAAQGVQKLATSLGMSEAAAAGLASALGPIAIAIAAIGVGAIALDKLVYTLDEAEEAAQKAASEYQKTQSELESLNSELETTSSRIDELKAKGSLTLVEQQELATLEAQNAQLERQIALREQLASNQAEDVARTSNDVLNNKGFSWVSTEYGSYGYKSSFWNDITKGYGQAVERVDMIEYATREQELLNDLTDQYNDLVNERDKHPIDSSEYEALDRQVQGVRNQITDCQSEITTYTSSIDEYYASITDGMGNALPGYENTVSRIEHLYDLVIGEAAVAQRKVDDYLSRPSKSKLVDDLVAQAKEANGITLDDIISQFDGLEQVAADADMETNEFAQAIADTINSMAGTIDVGEVTAQLRNGFLEGMDPQNMPELNRLTNQWDDWIATLTPDEIKILYTIMQSQDTSGWSFEDYQLAVQNAVETAEEASHDITKAMSDSAAFVSNLSTVQGIVSGYGTGSSTLTAEQYGSDALKDYGDALEYINGAYTLNAEKVREIAVAKGEEQIAINNANKALRQEEYTSNAGKIEQLRHELATTVGLTDEMRAAKEAEIRSLLSTNAGIKAECDEYNLLNASIREATDAYHNWLNAQNASQSGDMFDSSLSAFQMIDDVLNNTESELYGRVGRSDYQAAVEFLIPDSIDSDDEAAINSYMDSIDHLFQHDSNGQKNGLDISAFVDDAAAAGLLVYDESADAWNLAGQMTMQEFADGMGLSLPLVQAMIGEIEEYQKESPFKWADDAVQTMGDLAVSANEAAEKLRGMEGNEDLEIRMNFSGLADTESQIDALDGTIKQMQNLKAKVGVDSTEAEYANEVIAYCVAQQQLLTQPAIMRVDTSELDSDTSEAINTLQEFQSAVNELELQQELGLDTTNAQANVDALTAEVQALDADKMIELGIDTTSVETIQSSLSALDEEHLISIGIDASAIEGYVAPDTEADVVYHVNDTAVKSYKAENKKGEVVYSSRALPWTPPKYTTTLTVQTVYSGSVVNKPSSTSNSNNRNQTSVHGTAHVHGTAAASGDWGTAPGGKTLVGELGREIIVDPYTGKWYTVGDNGAEFTYVPRGAIVFNHLQSESLLKNGYALGRATALASGTAMALPGAGIQTRTINSNSAANSNSSSSNNSSSNRSSNNSSSSNSNSSSSDATEDAEDTLEAVDWIEIAIDRITRAIDKLAKTATSTFTTLAKRLGATYDEIDKTEQSIALQEKAYARYMEQAESVGLSSDLAEKVRNGEINIEDYDEDCRELIQDYQNWYEKALDCADAIDDLRLSLAQLYQDNFDNRQEDFENQLSLLEHMTNRYQSGVENFELHGYLQSTKFYEAMSKVGTQSIGVLKNELAALTSSMQEALDSGSIEEYSAEWYEMQQNINGVKEQIDEATNSLVEYNKEMREVEWGHFDYLQERISQITSEADFLIDLIGDNNLYQDSGQLNDNGMTAMGLHGQNYNVLMHQADAYAAEILKVNKQLANDPYNTSIIKRREELLSLQRKSILAAEEEKSAIADLVEGGIKIELSNLKELIDTYLDSLDSAKALYDYQKKVKDQTSEIASIQKQLSAYSNDVSEETRARVQKLQVELAETQEGLRETEYQQYISDQKKLLDNLYTEYETTLNKRLDDIGLLISDMTNAINANADLIYGKLGELGNSFGYSLSTELNGIWSNAAAKATEIKNALVSSDPNSATAMLIKKMEDEGVLSHTDATNLLAALNGPNANSAVSTIVSQLEAEGKISSEDSQLLQDAVNGDNPYSVINRLMSGEGAITTYSTDFGTRMTGVKSVLDTIGANVASMISTGDEVAEENYTSPSATTPSSSGVIEPPPSPSEPDNKVEDKSAKEAEEEPPSLSKGSLVSLKPGTYWYYTSYGDKPYGSADYWLNGKQAKISYINKSGTHPYGLTDPKTGGDWGWVRKKDIVGYKTGGMDYDTGLAMLHGTASKPEAVLNAEDTKNVLSLRDQLRELAAANISISDIPKMIPSIGNRRASEVVDSVLSGLVGGAMDTSTNVGTINISIPIEHVDDYNDLVYKMQRDGRFENMIMDMTVNRLSKKSSLGKYKQDFKQ